MNLIINNIVIITGIKIKQKTNQAKKLYNPCSSTFVPVYEQKKKNILVRHKVNE